MATIMVCMLAIYHNVQAFHYSRTSHVYLIGAKESGCI